MSNACTSKQTRYTGGFRVLSATHLRDLLPPPCGKICQCFQTFWHILVVWYVDYVDLLTMAMAVLDISELSTVLPPRCRKDGDWQTPGSIWFHLVPSQRNGDATSAGCVVSQKRVWGDSELMSNITLWNSFYGSEGRSRCHGEKPLDGEQNPSAWMTVWNLDLIRLTHLRHLAWNT